MKGMNEMLNIVKQAKNRGESDSSIFLALKVLLGDTINEDLLEDIEIMMDTELQASMKEGLEDIKKGNVHSYADVFGES